LSDFDTIELFDNTYIHLHQLFPTNTIEMAPAAVDTMDTVSPTTVKSENQKSMKVLEELLSKLSVSKAQDEINATSLDLASFINGDIVEMDAPTK